MEFATKIQNIPFGKQMKHTDAEKKALQSVFGRSADQHILNTVRESCQEAFNLPTFDTTLQTIKSHFFDRNYDAVFQNPEHLPVYSARYAPSRALCYYHMFLEHPVLMNILTGPGSRLLCIGSGAGSELVGIAAAMVHVPPKKKSTTSKTSKSQAAPATSTSSTVHDSKSTATEESRVQASKMISETEAPSKETAVDKARHVSEQEDVLVDKVKDLTLNGTASTESPGTGASESAIATLSSALTQGPADQSPKKAVKKAKRAQVTIIMQDYVDWSGILDSMESVVRAKMQLDRDRLKCGTEIGNVLDMSESMMVQVGRADLITFMFVLNELFQDKKRTMLLISRVVAAMKPGSHMLVADSAGSFSNLKVGERTYMVYMLLDHLKDLEIVYQDDACWYRCPPSVTYPLKLENMRHFVRIYKKL